MYLAKYGDYEQYVRSQRRTDAKKTPRVALPREEVSVIASYLKCSGVPVRRILCHGARNGQEVDWFQEEFPVAKTWGTDLFLKGHPRVVEHDFHVRVPRWVGRHDIVYSNCLDHSYDPMKALKVWIEQLKPTGRLCIQWTQWHRTIVQGDCFGAEFHEYLGMLNHVGVVVATLYVSRNFMVIVARRKK